MTAENPGMLIDQPNARELVQGALHAIAYFEEPLQSALDQSGNTHSLDNLFTLMILGKVDWFADDACFAICERVSFPQLCHYHIWLAGSLPGKGEGLRGLEYGIARRARELGCTHLTMAGRSGWLRATPEHWKAYNTMLRMDVNDAEHRAN